MIIELNEGLDAQLGACVSIRVGLEKDIYIVLLPKIWLNVQ